MSLQKNKHGTVIDGIAANAAEASRTAVIDVHSASSIGFDVSLVWAAASALTVQLYKSADGGVTYARVPSIAVASGTGTLSDYTASLAVSADDSTYLDLDVSNATHCMIIVGATGGGASDLISVRACSSSWS